MKILLLLGGGHSHVLILEKLAQTIKTHKVVLVSDQQYSYYSGMFPGYLIDQYQEKQIRFDLQDLCDKFKILFLRKKAKKIDHEANIVSFDDDSCLEYDILSINFGSKCKDTNKITNIPQCIPTRPIKEFKYRFIKALEQTSNYLITRSIAIVGAGAAGIELAFCISAQNSDRAISIFSSNKSLLNGKENKLIRSIIQERKMTVHLNEKIVKAVSTQQDGETLVELTTNNQNQYLFSIVVWTTGPESHELLTADGDGKQFFSRGGFPLASYNLQLKLKPNVFGGGDCVSFDEHDGFPPKNGVYALRQAPFLLRNLLNFANSKPLIEYQPQKDCLVLLNLGDGQAYASKYGFYCCSNTAYQLKVIIINTHYFKEPN